MSDNVEQTVNRDVELARAISEGIAKAFAPKGGVQRISDNFGGMTLSNAATPFGCCNFFDRCGDGDLMSLYYGGRLPLLDWMGFNVSDVCYKTVEFITYVRPEQYQGAPTIGYISDPCDDPNGVEYGSCKITVEDFGRIGRVGPTRDMMKPTKYCINDPLWRLDGTRVTDEREWDQKFVMDAILADVNKLLITGNAATGGQFGGLEYWVKTGYDCSILDSIVINWNGNPMNGGAGITWNGNPVAAGTNFVAVLLAVYRRIKQRISWAARLNTQVMGPSDQILLMPTDMIDCLLDTYTCWSVCGDDFTNMKILQTPDGKSFRDTLTPGLFGQGQVKLDGKWIPILGYDWELIKGPKTGDIYFLTGRVGAVPIWEGEHLDANVAVRQLGGTNASAYFSTDGGRVLWNVEADNLCRKMQGWIFPRLFCRAPFLQARFESVQCDKPGGFISPDPDATSFYPLTSFSAAVCPDDEGGQRYL